MPKYNLLYLKGSIPGNDGWTVRVTDTRSARHRKMMWPEPPPFPTHLPPEGAADEDEIGGVPDELLCELATPVQAAGQ